MTQEPWLGLEEVRRKRRLRKRWQKVVTALCAVLYPHSPRWLYILCSILVFLILLGACLVKEPNQAERK